MAHSSRIPMGTKSVGAGIAFALVAALALVIAPASARPDAAISISNPSLAKADAQGIRSDAPIRFDDVAAFSFDWQISDGASDDVSIEVELPAVFRNLDHGRNVALTVSDGDSATPVGTCAIAERSLTCALDGKRPGGATQLRGSIALLIEAAAQTDSTTASFRLNGERVDLALPGDGIGPRRAPSYRPIDFRKVAGIPRADSAILPWSIGFGTAHLAAHYAAAGRTLPLDGTVSTITLTDRLGPGQAFQGNGKGRWVLARAGGANEGTVEREPLADSSGHDYSTAHGDFDLNVEVHGSQATVRATGPWAADTNYAIGYATDVEGGRVRPGFEYANAVEIGQAGLSTAFSRHYTDPFSSRVAAAPDGPAAREDSPASAPADAKTAAASEPDPSPRPSPTPTAGHAPSPRTIEPSPRPSADPSAEPSTGPTPKETTAPLSTPLDERPPAPKPNPTKEPAPPGPKESPSPGTIEPEQPSPSEPHEPRPTGSPKPKPTIAPKPEPEPEPTDQPTSKPNPTPTSAKKAPPAEALQDPAELERLTSPMPAATPSAQATEASSQDMDLMEILGVETEPDFLRRVEDVAPTATGSRTATTPDVAEQQYAASPLPTVKPRETSGIPLLNSGMDMGGGVIFAFGMSLLGSGLVLRRYFG